MRILLASAAVCFLMVYVSNVMEAQDKPRAGLVGLSASFQSAQADILLPIWLSDRFSLAPAVGLTWAEDNGSDIRVGIAPRFFLTSTKVAPYIGGRVGVLIASPSNGDATTDWIGGLAFGGEYFIDDHFSVGVESQLNVTFSDTKSTRFGNPGKTNVNTGAAVFATVYF